MKKWGVRIWIAVLAILAFSAGLSFAGSQGEWEATLKISTADGKSLNKIVVGQNGYAGDEGSPYDVPAMLSGELQAYIPMPDGGQYWKNLRAVCACASYSRSWNVYVSTVRQMKVKVVWNITGLQPGTSLELKDTVSGQTVDMKGKTEYEFTGEASQNRLFVIEVKR